MSVRLVWHRGDLRVHDHPALAAAIRGASGDAPGSRPGVLGLVILDPRILDSTTPRRRALFYQNVRALRDAYRDRDGELLIRTGEPERLLRELAAELRDVAAVHAIASYTPCGRFRDGRASDALRDAGVPLLWHPGAYVHEPGTVREGEDAFYSVFSAFHRRWRQLGTPDALEAPESIPGTVPRGVDSGQVPTETTDVPLPEAGERAALAALDRFIEENLPAYTDSRDRLDGSGNSRLSIAINIGVLSPRTAAARVEAAGAPGSGKWLAELAWRDFMADLLLHRPDLLELPFDEKWQGFRWVTGHPSNVRFEAWRDGRTGVPVIDAAMRQLRAEGWISNRARIVAAQFLAKHLRVHWRRGEAIFKDWLLDGDTANNVGNWQWAAGLGVDNAPYFRLVNPIKQGEAHDPGGEWLARWVPESGGDAAPYTPEGSTGPVVDVAAARLDYLAAAESV